MSLISKYLPSAERLGWVAAGGALPALAAYLTGHPVFGVGATGLLIMVVREADHVVAAKNAKPDAPAVVATAAPVAPVVPPAVDPPAAPEAPANG